MSEIEDIADMEVDELHVDLGELHVDLGKLNSKLDVVNSCTMDRTCQRSC